MKVRNSVRVKPFTQLIPAAQLLVSGTGLQPGRPCARRLLLYLGGPPELREDPGGSRLTLAGRRRADVHGLDASWSLGPGMTRSYFTNQGYISLRFLDNLFGALPEKVMGNVGQAIEL